MKHTKKTDNNNFDRFVSEHKLLSAVITCAAFFAVFFCLNHFHIIYAGDDDLGVSHLLANSDPAVSFVGFFITVPCAFLQKFLGSLNVYLVLIEAASCASAIAINYVFMVKFPAKKALAFCSVFDLVYTTVLLVELQFTHAATASAAAGFALVFCGLMYEKRKPFRIIQTALGVLMMLFSSQLRYPTFKAFYYIGLVFAFGIIFVAFLKNKTEIKPGKAIKKALKTCFKPAVVLLLVICAGYCLNFASDSLKFGVEGYEEFKSYNSAIAGTNDYITPDYNKNVDFYESIDIHSQNDINTISGWYVDDDFYTFEKLSAISAYSKAHANNGHGDRASAENLLNTLKTSVKKSLADGSLKLYVIMGFFIIVTLFVIAMILRKQRYPLLPTFAFILLWAFFFAESSIINPFGGVNIFNIFVVPIAAVTIFVSVFYNKYQNYLTLIMSLAFFALYVYLEFSRLNFRSAISVFLPVLVLIILCVDEENIKEKYATAEPSRSICAVCLCVAVLFSAFTGVYLHFNETSVKMYHVNHKLLSYIDNHEDINFIGRTYFSDTYENPFIIKKDRPNFISFGGWDKKSMTYKNQLKKMGFKHMFADAVDSNCRMILCDAFDDYKILETYYNDHYAQKNKKIVLKKTNQFDIYSVYKVVSKEK